MTRLMIEADGLHKRYGDQVAVERVDLAAPAGTVLGVLGPNGAGKSTTIRMLTTITRPDGGTGRVGGLDVVADARAVRRMIGVTGQGVMNRFRTLPMSRSAVLAGRTVTDVLSIVLCGSIVLLTGLAIGWRPGSGHGLAGVAAGLGVAVAFSYAVSWLTACLGLAVKDPESAQAVGLMVLFMGAFISSCSVPTQGLPHWLRVIAQWNPVSAVADSCRQLFGNPNPSALTQTFPAQHAVPVALASTAAIVAICAPLATRLLRLRTTD